MVSIVRGRYPKPHADHLTSPRFFVVIQSWSDAPPTEFPTTPPRIATAHPGHRLGGFRAVAGPLRTAAVNHLMTSRDHWMLI